ncbi:origin recognition complex subunit 6-domain-containing protein [Phyllosticta citriasiana]|uniref:Origin recognition complex subunit 6-domain-containing protein n=1 Tax=Phyllosticta citriasiana TaxID=595635 RepID=A0ABR1KES1_9PEZI
MSRPLEQALAGLIPSHNGPLPPELTTMASSLLAQSRSKASSLKPEEEIARTYACAHLACERLKQRLNLPAIQPRPPVAPRTYRKVYDYFENALSGTGTPRKQQQQQQQQQQQGYSRAGGGSAANTPASAGRRRRAVVEADEDAAGRGRATPRSRAAATGATGATGAKDFGGEPPEWIMPLIRTLCKTLDAPAAVPHVYAGLRSVLRLTSSSSSLPSSGTRGRPTREAARAKSGGGGGVAEGDIAALVVALVFFVSVRMAGRATGKAEHDARRNKAAAVLMDCGYANGVDDKALAKQIDDMVARAGEQKWVDETQEWWRNVGEGVGVGIGDDDGDDSGDDADAAGDEDGDVEMTDAPAAVLSAERKRQRRRSSAAAGGGDKNASTPLKQSRADSSSLRGGLGTMMQESVDYLSEEKRRDYKVWRAKIMKQVEAIEKEDMAKSKGKSRAGG